MECLRAMVLSVWQKRGESFASGCRRGARSQGPVRDHRNGGQQMMDSRQRDSRFARAEWERRFLLEQFPVNVAVTRVREIADRYILGSRLRLRRMSDEEGTVVFKLTQKLDDGAAGAFQGDLTTLYLTEAEHTMLNALPARVLEKTRHSVAPLGIDVFKGELAGLVMAEVEFGSAEEAEAFEPMAFLVHEVTSDPRFTGGSLCQATRQQLIGYLRDFGMTLSHA